MGRRLTAKARAAHRAGVSSTLMVFRVRRGSVIARRDANAVGHELMRLQQAGPLTPERVVRAAEDFRNPLHKHFEWNDGRAAHAFRVSQARAVMRSIEVEVEDVKSGKPVPLRAFHPVRVPGQGHSWLPSEFVFEHRDLADQVVERARRELESWTERYKRYQWAAEVVPMLREAARFVRRSAKKRSSKVEGSRTDRKGRAA